MGCCSGSCGLDAQVVGIEGLALGHHRPQDASVLVGQRNDRLLPAAALSQRQRPAGDAVLASVGGHHGRLGSLNQQRAQVGVAPLCDAAQCVLATTGVLLGRQADPGPELRAVLELPEVAHAGHHGRRTHRADAHQGGRRLHGRVQLGVCCDALVAPGHVRVEFMPLRLRALQRQARQRAQLVAGVLQHLAQDALGIERWQRETYPGIALTARDSGADVYFWDESGFRADTVHCKTWAPKGKTPVINRRGQRQSISAASAVNAKGGFWFATYQGALHAELFIELLKKMMKGRIKPVHLVVDGLPAHKKANVREYIESTKGRLTMHILPGYAPDLNPHELVWSYVKRTGVARNPLRAGEKLEIRIDAQLRSMQKDRRLVRSFFETPSVAYISDC